MKSYTDLEQSQKLAETLPAGSADMCWCNSSIRGVNYDIAPSPLEEVIIQQGDDRRLFEQCYISIGEHIAILLDESGGRGIDTPIGFPPYAHRVHVGYAGGMNSDNVGDKLRYLLDHRSYAEFWIDMESGVRDADDWLDLDKVEQVLKACDPIIKEHELHELNELFSRVSFPHSINKQN